MKTMPILRSGVLGLSLAVSACATAPARHTEGAVMAATIRSTVHRGSDDLLTAGLGLDGLRSLTPPAFADPEAPTPAELRRRALWSNWRGIADLSPAGGYGTLYGSVAAVPGREYQALATLPGAQQPHRVLAQVPDAFDRRARCLLVAASSGSRGIYGAIAVAGAWGLPRGCAIAYTDKGAGTDYFDLDAGQGVRLDGTVGTADQPLAFVPTAPAGVGGVAFKHAHSLDNPEADWGRHVRQAAEFGLQALGEAFPDQAPFTFDDTRVIAVGISNGGGAVLRAAELEGDWLDAVVAGEPNVLAGEGGRSLYDYTTEAALLMPCALPHLGLPAVPDIDARCAALAAAGLVGGADTAARQASAYDRLRASGWADDSLPAGTISVGFDLWRAVAGAYASAYGRYAAGAHPCGYTYAAVEGTKPRAVRPAERASWWADGSGIPPGAGVALVDPAPADPLAGLQCLRSLWSGQGADAERVRRGVAQTRALLPVAGLPIIVVHGTADGLVPPAFSSAPYVAWAQRAGRDVHYWTVRNAQHFDAFLAIPAYGARYVPLLPYVYRALDQAWAQLDQGTPIQADRQFATTPRGAQATLQRSNLGLEE